MGQRRLKSIQVSKSPVRDIVTMVVIGMAMIPKSRTRVLKIGGMDHLVNI